MKHKTDSVWRQNDSVFGNRVGLIRMQFQIEGGTDTRSGKEIHPSPHILRRLAEALGDGDAADAERFYQNLMGAAGYLIGDENLMIAGTAADNVHYPLRQAVGGHLLQSE